MHALISVLIFYLIGTEVIISSYSTELHTSEQMVGALSAVIDEPDSCNGDAVVLVKTAVANFGRRLVIRDTWAKLAADDHNMSTLFVVGRSRNETVMEMIERESRQHGDILMGSFEDTYWNLTLKTVFTLNWIHQRCMPGVSAACVDDDVVLNPRNLLSFVQGTKSQRAIYGFKLHHDSPIRIEGHKNYVPFEVYPEKHWPDYCIGPGVVFSQESAGELFAAAVSPETHPKVWIDDCFIYGIVAKAIAMPVIDEPLIRTHGFNSSRHCFSEEFRQKVIRGTITWEQLAILWHNDNAARTEGCLSFYRKRLTRWICCLSAGGVSVSVILIIMWWRWKKESRVTKSE